MALNELDCTLLKESLDALSDLLRTAAHTPTISSSALKENTSAIASVKKKLKKMRSHPSQQFSLQELKVMYWSIKEMRETIRDFLAEAPLTDPDREPALETQKACNRLLRDFSASFSEAGIDIESLFSN